MSDSNPRVVKMGIDYGAVQVLSTSELDANLTAALSSRNISVNVTPLYANVPLINNYLVQRIATLSDQDIIAVFAHTAAVKAVSNILHQKQTTWQIACLDKTVYYAVQEYLPHNKVIAIAPDELTLSNELLKTIVPGSDYFFFAGNRSSSTIPTQFKLQQQSMESVLVYQTLIKAAPFEEHYNGILFCDEAAVDSFFVFNDFPKNTIAFCLNEDIANALTKKLTQATIVVQAQEPTLTSLIESVLLYYDRN